MLSLIAEVFSHCRIHEAGRDGCGWVCTESGCEKLHSEHSLFDFVCICSQGVILALVLSTVGVGDLLSDHQAEQAEESVKLSGRDRCVLICLSDIALRTRDCVYCSKGEYKFWSLCCQQLGLQALV